LKLTTKESVEKYSCWPCSNKTRHPDKLRHWWIFLNFLMLLWTLRILAKASFWAVVHCNRPRHTAKRTVNICCIQCGPIIPTSQKNIHATAKTH
jgi:hypothetical protein